MVDIYIIGTGIHSSLQLTREATQATARCRKLFALHTDRSVLLELARQGAEVIDLFELYERSDDSRLRADIYSEISDVVIQEAKANGGIVGLAVHGNPMFLVSAVENIIRDARRHELKVNVIPGISSFDTIQCDLGLDLGYGVQVLDSTTLVELQLRLEPRLPSLIFQLSTFRNAKVVKGLIQNSVLAPLTAYLQKFYPTRHSCFVVISSTSVYEGAKIIPASLDQIATSSDFSLEERPTLYLPAISSGHSDEQLP